MIRIGIRELFIWKVIIASILVVLSTEIFSIFDAINGTNIKLFWTVVLLIFIAGVFYLYKIIAIYLNSLEIKKYFSSFEFFFILLILLLTLLNTLLYSPNTIDAMAYHMPKVMHWVQNSNINFYPTDDLRQLVLAPFSEFVIMHLYLLTNVDNFSGLVQWYSMFICCITVSLIVKEFGCNYKYQIFSVLFCITLPMGILQSTSTQTDYVASMWLSLIAYFILKYINSGLLRHIFGFAFSLGLGILTKGTVYIFAFSFCIWIGLYVITNNRKHFIYLFTVPLIILILNIGHLNRNINLFGNPLGFNKESISTKTINEVINIETMTSNLVRNIGLNLSVPSKKINSFTTKKITSFLNYLNISTEDPATTWNPGYGYFIPFSFYESSAPNTFHFIIIIFFVTFSMMGKKKLLYNEKYYTYAIITGFILFSLLIKWTSVNNRLLLSFFILCSPIISLLLYKYQFNKLTRILSVVLLFYSTPYVLFNKSRPLLAEMNLDNKIPKFSKPFFLKQSRSEQYFIADKFYSYGKNKNRKDLYKYYSKVVEKIKLSNCDRIGFNSAGRNIEYPLWVLLKKNLDNKDLNFFIVDVENASASIEIDSEDLCAIVYPDNVIILN